MCIRDSIRRTMTEGLHIVGQTIPGKLKTDQSRKEEGVNSARDKILSRDELLKLYVQDGDEASISQFFKQFILIVRSQFYSKFSRVYLTFGEITQVIK